MTNFQWIGRDRPGKLEVVRTVLIHFEFDGVNLIEIFQTTGIRKKRSFDKVSYNRIFLILFLLNYYDPIQKIN